MSEECDMGIRCTELHDFVFSLFFLILLHILGDKCSFPLSPRNKKTLQNIDELLCSRKTSSNNFKYRIHRFARLYSWAVLLIE